MTADVTSLHPVYTIYPRRDQECRWRRLCHESRCCGGLHTAAGCRAWSWVSACSAQSTARPRHWQWSSLQSVNDDQSAQRDKSLDGSRGEAPSCYNNCHFKTLFLWRFIESSGCTSLHFFTAGHEKPATNCLFWMGSMA